MLNDISALRCKKWFSDTKQNCPDWQNACLTNQTLSNEKLPTSQQEDATCGEQKLLHQNNCILQPWKTQELDNPNSLFNPWSVFLKPCWQKQLWLLTFLVRAACQTSPCAWFQNELDWIWFLWFCIVSKFVQQFTCHVITNHLVLVSLFILWSHELKFTFFHELKFTCRSFLTVLCILACVSSHLQSWHHSSTFSCHLSFMVILLDAHPHNLFCPAWFCICCVFVTNKDGKWPSDSIVPLLITADEVVLNLTIWKLEATQSNWNLHQMKWPTTKIESKML